MCALWLSLCSTRLPLLYTLGYALYCVNCVQCMLCVYCVCRLCVDCAYTDTLRAYSTHPLAYTALEETEELFELLHRDAVAGQHTQHINEQICKDNHMTRNTTSQAAHHHFNQTFTLSDTGQKKNRFSTLCSSPQQPQGSVLTCNLDNLS